MSLLKRLEEIRELQGREALPDPTRIEGFGPGQPPPPDFNPPDVTDQDPFEEEFPGEDPAYPDPAKSPLVAAAQAPARPVKPITLSHPDLAVLDSAASFQGHSVTLSDSERQGVTRIVLGALERQLRELRGSLPRLRLRRAPVAKVEAPATKKRGRPRKVQA